MEAYRHKYEIQVRFKDVDMMRHVNHANYLSFVELARLKYYDHVLGADTDWHLQHGLIMARFEIDYKSAVEYDDTVVIYTRCSKLGNKSFEMNWIMNKARDGKEEIAAEGKAVIVCFDYRLKKAIEIPADRREKIRRYEGLTD
jgi:acyl-CoA thioester hydrolase